MRLRLAFRTGAHQGHVLEFDGPRTLVLGRSSQADIQVYDERISRRHCAVRIDEQGIRVKDMASGNGTFVNGVEVRETTIADGDVLMIGRTEIALSRAAAQAPAGGLGGDPGAPLPDLPPTMVPNYARPTGPTPPVHGAWPGQGAPAQGAPAPAAQGAGPGASRAQQGGPSASAWGAPVKTCALCQQTIPPALLPMAVEHRGRVICSRCAPRIEVPGYQIERTLGEGGMGVVYLARCQKRGVHVALKVLKGRGEMTEDARARFIREASTAAELDHRNIVRVLDMGEAPPFLYFAMEFVPGRSLKQWIADHGPLPLPFVVRVAAQVALALEHARERSIVHRDIKPENILVQDDGTAKLADFGLAKNTMSSGNSGLTRPGDGLGTLPYMPPEQIENALYADHRSDIYSFGATIYHMLTGRTPFQGRTTLEYFTKIRKESPPPISSFRKDVPRVLEVLVEKAMAKDPEQRFQQVGDMLRILQQFLRTEFDTRQTAS